MALTTNALPTYTAIGRREDLSDIIYMVDPTDTPFLTGIPSANATNTLHEWQTQALTAAAENHQLEGDEPTLTAATVTVRRSNTCSISAKYPGVTGTQVAVTSAGRSDEMAYQVTLKTLELRRDMEVNLMANNAEVTGGTTTARELGGYPTWITSNDSYGTGGSEGGAGDTAVTNGTLRDIDEGILKTVLRTTFTNGGDPDCIFIPPNGKQVMSTFTGNATRMVNAQDKELVAAIDVYRSDFGDLQVLPSRNMPTRGCFGVQKNMWAVAYLRRPRVEKLSKVGDSERRQVIAEYTLEARNQQSSFLIWDIN